MPHAFAPHAEATLVVREQHIRFLREAHVGARISIEAGVLELGEEDARVLFLMRHDDGQLAASFQMRLAHVTTREARAFPWPAWARARAEALRIDLPENAAPRSVPLSDVASQAGLPRALELGLKRTGIGAFGPQDCDPFGRMRAEVLMAKLSDCVTHLFADLPHGMDGRRTGAVVLEYRLLFAGAPRCGDRFEMRSGFAAVEPRVRHMVHWCLDPVTGRPWAAAHGAVAGFDMEARKMLVLDAAQVAGWTEFVVPGLSI
jgi:acyl-CoA thioester hydrolase